MPAAGSAALSAQEQDVHLLTAQLDAVPVQARPDAAMQPVQFDAGGQAVCGTGIPDSA